MSNQLPTIYQQFIHKSRYARWLPEHNRRETWQETVQRYTTFMYEHLKSEHGYYVNEVFADELEEAIINLTSCHP